MAMPIYIEEARASFNVCPLTIGKDGQPIGCLGKTCAAWRFATTHVKNPHSGDMARSDDTHGYCGMAGVPGLRFGEPH
jgi:hypothetical protein